MSLDREEALAFLHFHLKHVIIDKTLGRHGTLYLYNFAWDGVLFDLARDEIAEESAEFIMTGFVASSSDGPHHREEENRLQFKKREKERQKERIKKK